MNKKLLIATLSLAALAACTNDDFQSQNNANVSEKTSPVKFKLVNGNDALTRASMNGNTIVWNANDGDLFSLYHGSADLAVVPQGFQNATYKAIADESGATLSTPSMILEGGAVMVWPVDSVFRITSADGLTIVIPDEQTDIANQIPYVSDGIAIAAYDPTLDGAQIGWKNTAGLNREYPVYMRPMASQLIVNADYDGTDATIAELYTGEDAIEPISVTSVQLTTADPQGFTTEIPVTFTAALPADEARWDANVPENAWSHVTGLDRATATGVATLTTKCLTGNASSKFLILPQPAIAATGLDDAAVTVNTIYGKVFVADPVDYPGVSKYTTAQYNDAWYRYVTDPTSVVATEETAAAAPEASGDHAGKYKVTANEGPRFGLMQTINFFGDYTVPATSTSTVATEYMGVATQRYVVVDLTKLDMSDLHIKNDKQLRDAARVWKKMGLDDVVVYLDGDDDKEFEISQTTITLLNELNHDALGNYVSHFEVKPCDVAGEDCETIVITGGGDVQDMGFIKVGDAANQAKVAFNEGETWAWKGTVMVDETGVYRIYNRGTMVNDAAGESTLKTVKTDGTQNDVMLVNQGTWNVTAGTLFVQFDVTNTNEMNISSGAEFLEDGTGHLFRNWATNIPTRFGGDDDEIGVIVNNGVFATVNNGEINNHGLIEHANVNAKTYITRNQQTGNFAAPFSASNKMGRINLPYSNKDEDNISVSASLTQGFISVTVDGEVSGALDASVVGSKVNYVIVKSGITEIQAVSSQVKYLEINQPGTELAWNVPTATTYEGLMVLSNVNIKQGTQITVSKATYLGATMYVGGTFAWGSWSGYYGDTSVAYATKYRTY